MYPSATDIVFHFWRLMAGNDFGAVGAVLAHDFTLERPQSEDRVTGADGFASMNGQFADGAPWRFTVHRVVGGSDEAVSDVSMSDGMREMRVISFFEISGGKISQITEYWQDCCPLPLLMQRGAGDLRNPA
ncbi:nuclear transport factor 2 family protein [Noviherbaspirillum sp. 17J57-3]|uniref:Nuclear transport factor 2 family protein n=2 Tax=Noviherbaspirillum galbum TaxID=2709383 RepID=A0A6B3STA9_9BURK|nr:nuclear transport factor 2 family protein [Noviherbaspirillum galbum]